MLPRTVEYILGDPYRHKPLSIGSRVCRPTDRNALNTAFGKIDRPYRKKYSAVLRLVWYSLCLDFQSSLFRSFSDSLTEKVHLSTCHFRLIKNRRRLESSFVFSRLFKIEKASCVKASLKFILNGIIITFFLR